MKSDGFRGVFGTGWITEAYYFRLPFVLKALLGIEHLAIAHDPRPSSEPLYDALILGAETAGIAIDKAGMMPTPMLAKWAHDHHGFALMVSASHNPVGDNGIKFIGFELSHDLRKKAAELMEIEVRNSVSKPAQSSEVKIKEHYLGALKFLGRIKGHCLVDTAYGAWHKHLDVLEALGLTVDVYNKDYTPNKINTTGSVCLYQSINQYPKGYDYIIAFDGDGDRLQLVKDQKILDGDDILHHLSLGEKKVVGTVLTNSALDFALQKQGVLLYRSSVGDQWVKEMMEKYDVRYGAEPCGHILDRSWMGYSDPVYIMALVLTKGGINPIEKLYQYQVNLPSSVPLEDLDARLNHPDVRCVIRRSNTEPLVRVMLEGDSVLIAELVERYALNSFSISV